MKIKFNFLFNKIFNFIFKIDKEINDRTRKTKKKDNFSYVSYSAIKWIIDVFSKSSELRSYIINMDKLLNTHIQLSKITKDFDYEHELDKIRESCSLDELNFIETIQNNKILQKKYFEYKNNKPLDEISIEKIDLYNLLIEMRNNLENISKKPNARKFKSKSCKKRDNSLKIVITKEKLKKSKHDKSKELFKNKIFGIQKIQYTNDEKRNRDLNRCIEKSKKKSLYNRLGCNRSCRSDEISNNYKIMSKILHPDKNIDLNLENLQIINDAFQNISYAFKILKSFRIKYDLLLDKYDGDLDKVDEDMKLYPFNLKNDDDE